MTFHNVALEIVPVLDVACFIAAKIINTKIVFIIFDIMVKEEEGQQRE